METGHGGVTGYAEFGTDLLVAASRQAKLHDSLSFVVESSETISEGGHPLVVNFGIVVFVLSRIELFRQRLCATLAGLVDDSVTSDLVDP